MLRLLLLLLAVAAPALAAESPAVRSDRVTATLVSDTDAVAPGTPFHVALRLRIAPGWHTYWRNPGDAGAAPEVALTLPPGTTASGIAWPTPVRQPEGPLMTYAYVQEVVLPLTVTPGQASGPVVAEASWLVCARICVPEEGRFTLDLPASTPSPSAEAPLFAAAAARTPRPSPFEARVAPDGTLSLAGAGLSAATVRDAWFFPSGPGAVDQAARQALTVREGVVSLALKPAAAFKPGAGLDGVIVLQDPGGQETSLAIAALPGPARAATPLAQILLLAVLGGLVLNLMPCVFPVLAMKAVAIARLSGQGGGHVRAHALSYVAGVLLAFAGLGGVLLAARAGGEAAGWGFQFQSPAFVAGMAWVLFAVGLNLSGVFAVGGGLAGAGQGLAMRRGHAGSFFTGLLAVLVATPCTAPFMGAAVAAALAAPAALAVAVFLAMGLGFAAPYALLALRPGLARRLPRPGRWMDVLKEALAFPMYAAAAWLLWVVSLQSGAGGVLVTAAGMVLLAFAGWAFGRSQTAIGLHGRRLGRGLALAAVLAALAVLPGVAAAPPVTTQAADGVEPYSAARLAALRREGRPVFVNMTAAWCVTCLVNERVALSTEPVRQAFAQHNVAYLKGDWTRADPEITRFLRGHDRDGVPLYVLYPPSQGAPSVLPQVLTETAVLSELGKLGG